MILFYGSERLNFCSIFDSENSDHGFVHFGAHQRDVLTRLFIKDTFKFTCKGIFDVELSSTQTSKILETNRFFGKNTSPVIFDLLASFLKEVFIKLHKRTFK